MFCTKCGKQLKEGSKFCVACGNPVRTEQTPVAQQTPPAAPVAPVVQQTPPVPPSLTQAYTAPAPAPKKSGKVAIIIAIIAVAVVALLGVLGFVLHNIATIKLNKYIVVTGKGSDGDGQVVATIDWDEVEEDYSHRVLFFGDNRGKSFEKVLDSAVIIKCSPNKSVSNGDDIEISIDIDKDELKGVGLVWLKGKTVNVTMEGLPEATEESESDGDSSEEHGDDDDDEEEVNTHTYELVIDDVSFSEAAYACKLRGGHIVNIDNEDEFQLIVNQIERENKKDYIFWIGGERSELSYDYYWLRKDGSHSNYTLNDSEHFMTDEPSYKDGNIDETKMNMFYRQSEERYVWNDAPDDVLSVVPSYSGKIGYICEYDGD